MPLPTCPSPEQLLAFTNGSLSDEAAETIARHLDQCTICEDTVSSMEKVADSFIAELRGPIEADKFAADPTYREAVLAAQTIGGTTAAESGSGDDVVAQGPAELWELGQYRILAKLGEGGMGTVYKAMHTRLEKLVAIKVLPSDRTRDQRALARFEREMKAVGQLEHPNLVRAMDAGQADGTHFLVMEYVEGINLDALVNRLGPLPVADACELVRQAALGLHYAHEHGLIHRDIKPSNLMLTLVGQADSLRHDAPTAIVKILDLGLALLSTDKPADGELTGSGQAIGTADYMSPEQAFDSHHVDLRTDIYSLGCTLYKLLTGRAPFGHLENRGSMARMLDHVRKQVPSITTLRSDIPEPLGTLLERMLAKAPAERIATSAEVASALEPFAARSDLRGLICDVGRVDSSSTRTEDFASTNPVHSLPSTGTYGDTVTPVSTAQTEAEEAGSMKHAAEQGPEAAHAEQRETPRAEADKPAGEAVGAFQPLHASLPQPAARRHKVSGVAVGLVLFGAAALIVAGIIIRIKNQGQPDTVIEAPPGSKITIEEGGELLVRVPASAPASAPTGQPPSKGVASKPSTERTKPKPIAIKLEPEPLEMPAGAPMTRMAIVAQPAPVKGVRSWTIETIGHRDGVASLKYSPDARLLATGSQDGTIRLWEAAQARFLRAIVAHDAAITGVTWSPDSRMLASASHDKTVRIWDVQSGRRLLTFSGPTAFTSVGWSPAGRFLAACCRGNLYLWNLAPEDAAAGPGGRVYKDDWRPVVRGVAERVLSRSHVQELSWVAWSPDGQLFAVPADGYVNVCDPKSCKITASVQGDSFLGAWSPDGKELAIGSCVAYPLRVWNAETGVIRESPLRESQGLWSLAWSPDARMFAFSSHEKLFVSGARDWKLMHTHDCTGGRTCDFASDGTDLAYGDEYGRVMVYEAASGRTLDSLPAHATFTGVIAWSPDQKMIASWGKFGGGWRSIHFLDIGLGQVRHEARGDDVLSIAWSPSGNAVAQVNVYNMQVWNIGTASTKTFGPWSDSFRYSRLVWSPDGKRLATGMFYWENFSFEGRVWEATSGKELCKLPVGKNGLGYSPDGKLLAIGDEKEVRLCDAETGQVRQTLPAAPAPLALLSWSPDGKTLAASCTDKNVYLFDVGAKRISNTCAGHKAIAASLCWSDGGKTLLSASDSEICAWDVASGKLRQTVPAEGGVFSPDGRLIASGGPSLIRLRRTDDGRLDRTLLDLRNQQHAALSPDGHYRGSPDVEKEFVYVVQTDTGQETLSPEEYSKRYGWTNDPKKAIGPLPIALPGTPSEAPALKP